MSELDTLRAEMALLRAAIEQQKVDSDDLGKFFPPHIKSILAAEWWRGWHKGYDQGLMFYTHPPPEDL